MVIGAFKLFNFGTVFIKFESRHAIDVGGLRTFSILVDIELPHCNLGVVGNMTFVDRADSLTGWAPSGSKVNH